MIKNYLKAITLLVVLLLEANVAKADVDITAENFPDANFRTYVQSLADGASVLTDAKLAGIQQIDCSGKSISDLTGIAYFTNLKYLLCENNSLQSLDLSGNTALISVKCDNNNLTSLVLGNNTQLTTLVCFSNKLQTIDVASNTGLKSIVCYKNSLENLDVTKNVALNYLDCSYNELTTIGLAQNTVLATLNVSENPLTGLDVSANVNLVELYCYSDSLRELDLTTNVDLQSLLSYSNHLCALDLSANNKLVAFNSDGNTRTIEVNYTYEQAGETIYYIDLDADETLGGGKELVNKLGHGFDLEDVVSGSWTNASVAKSPSGGDILKLDGKPKMITYGYNTGYTGTTSGIANVTFTVYLTYDNVTTEMDAIDGETVRIWARHGALVNERGVSVAVYGLDGRLLYDGDDVLIALPEGMYLVKIDTETQKVVVK